MIPVNIMNSLAFESECTVFHANGRKHQTSAGTGIENRVLTMRACLLRKPAAVETNPLEFADVPAPTPGLGEVLVRVSACGVCRTDLHVIEGELPPRKSPVIPGHQVVGVIEKCGEGAQRFAAGERVGIAWMHQTDGVCEYCRSGAENLCDNPKFTGYSVDGGYAEYVVAPQDFVYAIPQGFPDEQAAPLFCAGIIGFRSLRLSGVKSGARLGFYGFGAAAHVAIQVARHWGVEVYASTRDARHQKLAMELGARGRAKRLTSLPKSWTLRLSLLRPVR
jgi:propanol-preferring alcohol dehydrogenase